MEQLSGETIERLLARARAGVLVPERGFGGSLGEPWARPRSPGPASPGPTPGFAAAPSTLPVGVERRLVRRAEALWASLCAAPEVLPSPESAAQLLAPPYAGQALLISLPPHPADPASGAPRIAFVGEALLDLGLLVPGTAEADPSPGAPLGARLVALAVQAAATRQPAHFDSEADPAPPRLRPQLLMRAVALPFASEPGAGPTAAVITSWRKLLSSEETAALHRELAAAIDWMQQHRA
jgi:hypothetical protein